MVVESAPGLTPESPLPPTPPPDSALPFGVGLTRLTGLDKGINLVELNLTGNQIIK